MTVDLARVFIVFSKILVSRCGRSQTPRAWRMNLLNNKVGDLKATWGHNNFIDLDNF
jgi:hypothetical protein